MTPDLHEAPPAETMVSASCTQVGGHNQAACRLAMEMMGAEAVQYQSRGAGHSR